MENAAGLSEGEESAKAADGETVVDDSVEEDDEPLEEETPEGEPVDDDETPTEEEDPADETSIEEEGPIDGEGEPTVIESGEDEEFTELNLVADLIAF
jgi:hypothetical protein